MDDEDERRRGKPETFVRSTLTSSCATPRHQWRSPTWNPVDKPPTPFTRLTPPPPTPTEDLHQENAASSTDLTLCPPMGSLSVSDQPKTEQENSEQQQQGPGPGPGPGSDPGQGTRAGPGPGLKKKLPLMRLDLGAITSQDPPDPVTGSSNWCLGSPEVSDSDKELQQKREKLAECDRQCTRILGHLYFGSKTIAENYAMLRRYRITHILNCVGMVCPSYFPNDFFYKTLFLLDSPSEDILCVLYDVFDFIEDVREQAGGRVFIHCCQGVSRSAALVIAYVMWRERRPFDQVFDDVKQRRSVTCPNIGFVFQLTQWQQRLASAAAPQPHPRLYRMAPLSAHCAVQLVPRAVLGEVTLDALDSRGVFVLQLPTRLYVWRGRGSDKAMAAAAERAAFQLVRYEHAQGPIVVAMEGREPPFLLNSLRREGLVTGGAGGGGTEVKRGAYAAGINHAGKAAFGLKLVSPYDADFELYNKGRAAAGGGMSADFNTGLQPHPTPMFPASPRVGRWRVMRPQVNHIATRW